MGRLQKRVKEFTSAHLELPKDIVFDLPRVTLIGPFQIYIENYQGIVQFTPQMLQLRLKKGELKIVGDQLVICNILPEEMMVEGKIQEIYYID